MKAKLNLMPIGILVVGIFTQRLTAGTWSGLSHSPPDGINAMLLLSDGTVMAAGANTEATWYRLTPDSAGSYLNGTWSALASMHDARLYFASDVLTNGQVFVAGGEYGTGQTNAEVYDPLSNVWTLLPPTGQNFYDAISKILPDGRVLIAPASPTIDRSTFIYDPASNAWTNGGLLFPGRGRNQAEASWVKLPDDSILTIDPFGTNSERYIPSLNQWINDANIPVSLYDTNDHEIGAAFLLPDGRAFFLGASGNTAFYTPSGNTNMGSWQAGPVIPNGQATPDAPAAMMINGKILCATSPKPTSGNNYPSPTSFYEFDPVSNSFTQVSGPFGTTYPQVPYAIRMLDLPDGEVLVAFSISQLYAYQPSGPPLAASKPTIININTNSNGTYHLTGTLLNGISEGAAYGDDAQMDSNYPLIRMTNVVSGKVYYARTFNWSSTSVMTGTNVESTDFAIPNNVPVGIYSLVVVANGNSSDPVTLVTDPLQITPASDAMFLGQPGGPFTLTSQNFSLTNFGDTALNWSLNNTSSWLNVSPTGGTLTPGGAAATLTASFNANASNLLVGTYSTTVTFTNLNTLATQTRTYDLTLQSPLNGGFESGNFNSWIQSGNTGRTAVTTLSLYIHSGTYGVRIGPSNSLGYISQSLTTSAGQNYLLSFWLKNVSTGIPNQFVADWNGMDIYNQSNFGAFAWTNMQFLVTATANSTVLQFGFRNDVASFGLDDISIKPISSATFQSADLTNNAFRFAWSTTTGLVYQVQYKTNFLQTNWINLGGPVRAVNSSMNATDAPATDSQRFYRLLVSP